MLIGDKVESALAALGVDKARVEAFLGRPCRCHERRESLNQLHRWAARVVQGKTERAREFLEKILSQAD